MEAYLDNSATTRCLDKVADKMVELLTVNYGNPSAMHLKGVAAEMQIREAKKKIAKTLKAKDKEILFTSGGTESNNLAIIGTALANERKGKHIITTSIEHPSINNPMLYLESKGFEIEHLKVDEYGQISLEDLKNKVRKDTILVSIMHVNNEIGALEPIYEAASIVKEANSQCIMHVDAIQSYGKFKIVPGKNNIDLLSVSGHKIHGPKGSGFLYIKDKTKINPIILGGGQQDGMRSGTENVPAYVGLSIAAEEAYNDFQEKIDKLYQLKEYFISKVSEIEDVYVNGRKDKNCAPHIISVSVKDVRAEVLLHSLEEYGVFVSAGSACSSNHPGISSTLKEIGLKQELLDSTIRFSMSSFTSKEELDYAIEIMMKFIPQLRKYTRR